MWFGYCTGVEASAESGTRLSCRFGGARFFICVPRGVAVRCAHTSIGTQTDSRVRLHLRCYLGRALALLSHASGRGGKARATSRMLTQDGAAPTQDGSRMPMEACQSGQLQASADANVARVQLLGRALYPYAHKVSDGA